MRKPGSKRSGLARSTAKPVEATVVGEELALAADEKTPKLGVGGDERGAQWR
jgi:hypothetical protein